MNIRLNKRWRWWLLALGLTLAVTRYFNGTDQTAGIVAATTHPEPLSVRKSGAVQAPAQEIALEQLRQPRTVTDTGDLFRTKSWYVPPPPAPAPPPPVAVAPPLPFSFLGKVLKPDGQLTLFIADKDQVYLVHGGESLGTDYHVDGIENGKLALTYLPMKKKQYLELSGGQ
ncbi:MAG: hypothetical protein GC149_17665 [Gammaproteobacteria bacterium]|nr:hypothetical protein [Gammaproteobacteria bacterium]